MFNDKPKGFNMTKLDTLSAIVTGLIFAMLAMAYFDILVK